MRGYRISSLFAAIALALACNGPEPELKAPEAPDGLTLARYTANSLTYTWNEVDGAVKYGYRLTDADGGVVTESETFAISVTARNLAEGLTYYMAVKSIGEGVSSEYCSPVEGRPHQEDEGGEDGSDVDTPLTPPASVYAAMMIPEYEEDGVARAFPGAEGGGMYTTGGRGGQVYHVTSLEDNTNAGTLRYAIEKGPRPLTVVFDVAGTIALKKPLKIEKGDISIAGQTAPGDGICIKDRYTQIAADNVIIRFVRFRLGDEGSGAGDSDDCIWGRYHKDIILDHCSFSWSIDEGASFYSNTNFTMQWCIIAESMKNCSIHSKGSHGYGGIWGGENASFHHNLMAHNDSRNPRFDHPHVYTDHNSPSQRGVVDFRNNVVYNWGSNSSYGGEGYGNGKGDGINMIANYYKPGPNSSDRKYFLDAYGVYSSCSTCGKNIEDGYPLTFLSGNVHTKYQDISDNNRSGIYWHNGENHFNYNKFSSNEFAIKGPAGQRVYTSTHQSSAAMEAVTVWAGASLKRDKVDARICADVKKGTGKIIDDIADVRESYGYAWPSYSATEQEKARTLDTDGDGIPDWFEDQFGLDKNAAGDGASFSIDNKGRYTNLEMYLHYLVRELTEAQTENGEYK